MTASAARDRFGGCCACDAWADEMITLARYGAQMCRKCPERLGRFLRAASEAFLAEHFLTPTPFRKTAAFGPPRMPARDVPEEKVDVEQVFDDFKRGIAKQISEDDGEMRMDLAIAYYEIGRISDAVREAAYALSMRQPASRASRALNWIFEPERSRSGAFRAIVLVVRG